MHIVPRVRAFYGVLQGFTDRGLTLESLKPPTPSATSGFFLEVCVRVPRRRHRQETRTRCMPQRRERNTRKSRGRCPGVDNHRYPRGETR
ncbi:hypothetical protein PUN28_011303 [Cardiocondyla obscurior]|uniref:Uncharacterized protein n=1 Tax=Cardiocondyla obscurior TaxID=286306 RepID=A0AAW2FEE2_9HYME